MEKQKDFVVIHFKTLQGTTLNGTECLHMPIQFGMVKYINGEQVGDVRSSYIDPPVPKPWDTYFGIHISSEHCNGANTFNELYPEIVEFAGDLPVVFYCCSSDVYAFKEACAYFGFENKFPKSRFIDPYTQCLAKYNYPTRKSSLDTSLSYWVDYFKIKHDIYLPHQCAYDVDMCAKLYLYLQTIDVDSILERRPPNPGCFRPGEKKDKSLFGKPVPNEEVIYPDNPLNRKNVCLTGFAYSTENSLNLKLKKMGAGRHDNVIRGTDIVIPSKSYLEKEYDIAPTGKLATAINDKKYIMIHDELKEILVSLGIYEGELDGEK